MNFKLVSEFKPTGDQPQAIEKLTAGFLHGQKFQTLMGVTGSGKTFTMANVIEKLNRPTLVIAHNKTLAAQLYSEFKEFFPDNAVEYFVSYYDYYQPEVYMPATDTYIEKDSAINDEIDKLRYSATASLFDRRDVIVVASVSCIYGLGNPDDYNNMILALKPGLNIKRDDILGKLIELQYIRNDYEFKRGTFRVRGDVIEIFPSYSSESALRIEMFGDEIERILEIEALSGKIIGKRNYTCVMPASHYVTSKEKLELAIKNTKNEMHEQVKKFRSEDKLVEAERIERRTNYDIEMMREVGFCSGIENYSRHIENRPEGSAPYTLMDYFPDDFLIIVDESHVTIPQINAMYKGDMSRKGTLIDYGFRLPSARDNRPLKFSEFESKINQMLFVSATPANYEKENSSQIVEQIIRPTGLLDPEIFIHSITGQIDNLIEQIKKTVAQHEKILVTTLTKKMAENLTDYLKQNDIRVKYLHSDIDTLERVKIIHDLRTDVFDVIVGINLLREGLDIPEVSLITILDADKEGFLRSSTSLIQTIGRAARNANGKVIMYADTITNAMQTAIDETQRRRNIQQKYNAQHNIIPQTIKKEVRKIIKATQEVEDEAKQTKPIGLMTANQIKKEIKKLTNKMEKASLELDFESAINFRDQIEELKKQL